jgi:hypothetical protein
MEAGSRVLTDLGQGTVLGFEFIEPLTCRSVLMPTDTHPPAQRVMVQLDHPENWTHRSEKQPHPWVLRYGNGYCSPELVH